MPGTLYVVATPIGNLEDVTFRALAGPPGSVIDRRGGHPPNEPTPSTLLDLDADDEPSRAQRRQQDAHLIARLRGGESIALVSDAGTPVVSDPGAQLVAAAHAAGIRVEPVPGPSAAMAALSASGMGGDGFLFVGFPPARAGARTAWLSRLAAEPRPLVLYEAPHRIRATLEEMLAYSATGRWH